MNTSSNQMTLRELHAAMKQAAILETPILSMPPLLYSTSGSDGEAGLVDQTALQALSAANHSVQWILPGADGALNTFVEYAAADRSKTILLYDDLNEVRVVSTQDFRNSIEQVFRNGAEGESKDLFSVTLQKVDAVVLAAIIDLHFAQAAKMPVRVISESDILAFAARFDTGKPPKKAALSALSFAFFPGISLTTEELQPSLERLKMNGMIVPVDAGWSVSSKLIDQFGEPDSAHFLLASSSFVEKGLLTSAECLVAQGRNGFISLYSLISAPDQVKISVSGSFPVPEVIRKQLSKPAPVVQVSPAARPKTPAAPAEPAQRGMTRKTKIALAVAVVCAVVAACGCITTVVSLLW